MYIDKLKTIWEWLLKLSPDFLRFLVMILLGIILVQCNMNEIRNMFKQEMLQEEKAKQDRELYMKDITPKVYNILLDVLDKDDNATNVLLLNYHNTVTSSHGLSYCYLTGLCESFKESTPIIDYWKELDYMNYGEEIQKINVLKCLLMLDIKDYRHDYPKFTYILERSDAQSAIFYPIIGVDGPVGMLVILYKDEIDTSTLDKLNRDIPPSILPLAVLLDYNYVKSIK